MAGELEQTIRAFYEAHPTFSKRLLQHLAALLIWMGGFVVLQFVSLTFAGLGSLTLALLACLSVIGHNLLMRWEVTPGVLFLVIVVYFLSMMVAVFASAKQVVEIVVVLEAIGWLGLVLGNRHQLHKVDFRHLMTNVYYMCPMITCEMLFKMGHAQHIYVTIFGSDEADIQRNNQQRYDENYEEHHHDSST